MILELGKSAKARAKATCAQRQYYDERMEAADWSRRLVDLRGGVSVPTSVLNHKFVE
jgi:hypothetical protein